MRNNEEAWLQEKQKIKESLKKSSIQNKEIADNKKYVGGFRYLRKLAKVKFRNDNNVIEEEEEDDQVNVNTEP